MSPTLSASSWWKRCSTMIALQSTADLRENGSKRRLFVVERLVDEVDQRRNHILRQQLAGGDQRRRHLQVVVALKVLGVRRMKGKHHLQTVHDHKAELVLGRNAQSGRNVAGLFIDYIGVGAKLPLTMQKTLTSMALR